MKNEVAKGEQTPAFLLHDADAGSTNGPDSEAREKQVWERLQREALAAQRFRLEQELLLRQAHVPLHALTGGLRTAGTPAAPEETAVEAAEVSPDTADDASPLLFWMVLGFVLTSVASLLVWLFYGLA
ncbi:MAG: hypothetical protein KDI44_02215 [Thiothrix sp.]|nr:hypothetical protein [Thiothrix sp.]